MLDWNLSWDDHGGLDLLEGLITLKTVALVREAGEELLQVSSGLMQNSPKSGRKYGSYTASAPGEAPGVRTGRLLRSAFMNPEDEGMAVVAGFEVDYSKYLDGGTKRMAARPFFGVSVDPVADHLTDNIRKMVEQL